jgi:hypothetical protein
VCKEVAITTASWKLDAEILKGVDKAGTSLHVCTHRTTRYFKKTSRAMWRHFTGHRKVGNAGGQVSKAAIFELFDLATVATANQRMSTKNPARLHVSAKKITDSFKVVRFS